MIPQISASTSVTTLITQSSVAHLSQQSLRYGESTLAQSSVSKKALIIIGLLAMGTFLFLMCRKMFSKNAPNEIQDWIKQNYEKFNTKHQEEISCIIALIKKKMERTPNPSAAEIFDNEFMADRDREGFNIVKPIVLRYFETHPIIPPTPTFKLATDEEIRIWLTARYKNVAEDVIGQVISKVHEIEKHPVCAKAPKAHILALRLGLSANPNPIQSKAIGYLSIKHDVMRKGTAK